MKKTPLTIVFSTIALFSCGGGGGESNGGASSGISQSGMAAVLSNTSWTKECSPENKPHSENATSAWNTKVSLRIDTKLESRIKTEYFHPNDEKCNSMMFERLDIAKFEIKGRVTTEESIRAYGLNEVYIYSSETENKPTSYTLIYLDTEKLYFGQESGDNLGETPQTRHSSISLDDYFIQNVF